MAIVNNQTHYIKKIIFIDKYVVLKMLTKKLNDAIVFNNIIDAQEALYSLNDPIYYICEI